MSDWQPIETAPQEERVLIWTDTRKDADDFRYVHQVCEGEHVILAQVGILYGSEWTKELIGKPTHWQPLPSPPTPQQHNTSTGDAG